MPIDNNGEERYSLNSLIRNSLNNYEILINKYEKLLVDNTTLNTLINEKLASLPVESEVRQILEELMDDVSAQIGEQQQQIDLKEDENVKSITDIVNIFQEHVRKLLSRLNFVLACISIGAVVGGVAIYYVNSVLDIAKKERLGISNQIIDQVQDQKETQVPHIYYVDETGKSIKIPIHLEQPKK